MAITNAESMLGHYTVLDLTAEFGHSLEVDLVKGAIENLTTEQIIPAEPIPEFLLEIAAAGGLIPHTKKCIT